MCSFHFGRNFSIPHYYWLYKSAFLRICCYIFLIGIEIGCLTLLWGLLLVTINTKCLAIHVHYVKSFIQILLSFLKLSQWTNSCQLLLIFSKHIFPFLDSSYFDMTQDIYFTCHIHHLEFRISLVYFHFVNGTASVTYAK